MKDHGGESGQEHSAAQSLLFDFPSYRNTLVHPDNGIAPTFDRFFEAGKSEGDYHDNFDTITFYKALVALEMTYPKWCKEMQRRQDLGDGHPDGLHPWTEHPFWDKQSNKPARYLHLFADNAPYHHGVQIQLNSKSKSEITSILRQLGIKSIRTSRPEPTATQPDAFIIQNFEVPTEGQQWERGNPSLEELRIGALNAIKVRHPQLVEPPYKALMESKKGVWGPADSLGWVMEFSAPYVSPQVCIELRWAYGKNFVAANEQQTAGRTLAEIVEQLRRRFYDDFTVYERWFKHAEKEMNKWILRDFEISEGPLSGNVDDPLGDSLKGFTIEDLNTWKARAGMSMDGSNIDTNDEYFNDENC